MTTAIETATIKVVRARDTCSSRPSSGIPDMNVTAATAGTRQWEVGSRVRTSLGARTSAVAATMAPTPAATGVTRSAQVSAEATLGRRQSQLLPHLHSRTTSSSSPVLQAMEHPTGICMTATSRVAVRLTNQRTGRLTSRRHRRRSRRRRLPRQHINLLARRLANRRHNRNSRRRLLHSTASTHAIAGERSKPVTPWMCTAVRDKKEPEANAVASCCMYVYAGEHDVMV